MEQKINIATMRTENKSINARRSMYNKITWNDGDRMFFNMPKQSSPNVVITDNKKSIEGISSFSLNITDIKYEFTFNNVSLEAIRGNYQIPPFADGNWEAIVSEENGRMVLTDVTISQGNGHHPHKHPVFKKVEFRDIVITLDIDGVEKKIYLDKGSINYDNIEPLYVDRRVGFEGKLGKKEGYQMGIKQTLFYQVSCADTFLNIEIQFSFVFMYPLNDFEPTGVIDANKIFPQIEIFSSKTNLNNYINFGLDNLYSVDVPEGKDGNKIRIKKYNARIKLICNNNSDKHITFDGNGKEKDYFYDLPLSEIPPMFQRNFNYENYGYDIKTRNIAGLYTDSNFGTAKKEGTADSFRDKPNIKFEITTGDTFDTLGPLFNKYFYALFRNAEPAALWSNIFDYARYNLVQETEFVAVHGIQSHKFNTKSSKFTPSLNLYTYPPNQSNYKITLFKEPRQAAYDNIHLHGYLGHYTDNLQPVIHAPICGYCCFHMHWRWSKLNVDLAGSLLLRLGTGGEQYLFDDSKDKYKGWHTDTNTILMQEPFKKDGMPLIPYEQQLKIAITDPDVLPFDEENNVTPTTSPTLNLAEKAVWYCVEIINDDFGNNSMHLVLEQGCGYAFDYSDAGESNVENPRGYAVLPKLFRKICEDNFGITESNYANFLNYIYDASASKRTKLNPKEFYEIQYRIMRLFNDLTPDIPAGRRQLNQVPGVNGSILPLSFDENTDTYLQQIFESMVNQ